MRVNLSAPVQPEAPMPSPVAPPGTLPLISAKVRADAAAGLCRVVLEQVFQNPHDEVLHVTYLMPLPADAAVSGFVFHIGERVVRGVVRPKKEAREEFERAMVEGRSGALLEQERQNLFQQEIGNIPPHAEVKIEIEIDQPLFWLSEGAWELRFPLAAAPRYLGTSELEGNIDIAVASTGVAARASLELEIRDELLSGRSPESPSHALSVLARSKGFVAHFGGDNRMALDRDVVVRWPVATPDVGLSLDVAQLAGDQEAQALLSIVPPIDAANAASITRELTLLLDTSGSMSGEPIAQEKRVALALIDSLGDEDTLEMIEFSFQTRAFAPRAQRATPATKRAASAWIQALVASGGTEMVSGVKASLSQLAKDTQRQIVMITDGLVGFERSVVRALLDGLPPSARFHVVGVGSAVNRALVMPIARAGRGTEAIIGLGEDAERVVARLQSHLAQPLVVDVVIAGSAVRGLACDRVGDLFAAAPLRVALALRPEGGEIVVRGRTASGPFERCLRVPAVCVSEERSQVSRLFAREAIETLEMQLSGGEPATEVDPRIEALSLRFGIISRLTSFVATTEEAMVDPTKPYRRTTQPQALPFGMSAEGLGLRSQASAFHPPASFGMLGAPGAGPFGAADAASSGGAPHGLPKGRASYGSPPPPSAAPPRAAGAPPPPPPPMAQSFSRSAPAPGAPAAPPAGKQISLGRRMADGLRDMFGSEQKKSEAPAAARESEAALDEGETTVADEQDAGGSLGERGVLRWLMRLSLVQKDAIVLELNVPAPGLEFDLAGAVVTLIRRSGERVEASIDTSRSAGPASYAAGVSLRIVVTCQLEDAGDLASLTIVLQSGQELHFSR